MKQQSSPFTTKRIAIALIVCLVLLIGWMVYSSVKFHIVSTNPNTAAVSKAVPFFKINFNKTLASKVSISSTPDIIKSYKVSGKTITITFWPLELNKQYRITLSSVTSTSGSKITNKYIWFTTKDLPVDGLPADQQKAIVNGQDHYPSANNDPILKYLPYSNLDFTLTPQFVTDDEEQTSLVLQADLSLSTADLADGQDAAVARYKQEVVDYITSLNLDPAKYTIVYDTAGD